jgi:hypothetical protein
MSDDLRPYRRLDGGPGGFRLSDAPPAHRFQAQVHRRSRTIESEYLYRVATPEGKPAWIWWREVDGWPHKLDGTPFRFFERSLHQAAEWFAKHNLPLPGILAEDLAREAAPSGAPTPPAAEPAVRPKAAPAGATTSGTAGPADRPEGDQTDRDGTPAVEARHLVTLDQAAAAVNKTKRALEYYKTQGTLPAPVVEGGGGKAALYDWRTLRSWLTKTYGIPLPEQFPGRKT